MTAASDNTASTVNSDRRVRTRFAPSPTGFLHIGALRTALFSWLLARHHGGDFILRIEDTDQNRLVPGSLESIIASFAALGLDIDEGPDRASVAALNAEKYGPVRPDLLPDVTKGEHGPYFQSQRLARYHEVVNRLIAEDKAYYAFETPEELDGMRAAAKMRGQSFLYRGRYRNYPLEQAKERVAAGETHVVRFKMPTEGPIRTHDALRGVTDWDAATQDDFVILKADGYPPYHLAAIVDDYDMEISHAIRSTEWLSSSPKHFALYQALGWEPPLYIHVANVNGKDGKKLSKRTGAKPVVGRYPDPETGEMITGYIEDGFLPDALFNYMALTGWSPGDDTEIMDRDEIIRRFGIDGLAVSPAQFDLDKLKSVNAVYIRDTPREEIIEKALPFLQEASLLSASPTAEDRAYAAAALALEAEKIKTLAEAPLVTDFFFPLIPEYQVKSVEKWLRKNGEKTAAYLSDLRAALEGHSEWEAEALEALTREVGGRHGREKGDLTHPVRVAVTGREVGPSLFDTMAVLGKERILARLDHAVKLASGEKEG